jgi:ATP-binding cassette subfamily B protein
MSDLGGTSGDEDALADPAARRLGLRLIVELARQDWKRVVVAGALAIALNGLRILIPLMVREAVDHGLDPYESGTLVRWGFAILTVALCSTVVFAVQWYAVFLVALRAETEVRQRLFDQFQRLHFAFHDRAPTGELMARATTDLQQIQMLFIWIPLGSSLVLTVVAVAVILVAMSPLLAVLSLAPLVLFLVAAISFSRRMDPMAMTLQQALAEVSGAAEESITGIRVVKGFGAEDAQRDRLGLRASRVWQQGLALAGLRSRYAPLLEQIPLLGVVAVLAVGGRQVIDGRLTLGQLVAFNSFILLLVTPLRYFAFLISAVSRATVAAARVQSMLRLDPEIADASDATDLAGGPGEVRFEDVHFDYGGTAPVLAGVDLVIRAGESVALVGRTGSGKSTLARLLPRFYEATSGRILLDGSDVTAIKLASLRRAVGIVFEDTFLFTDTIRANIAFAEPSAQDDVVERAARLAGAEEFIDALPQGYDTILGESGFSLSGGQRQRIAIARAILADPRVLILDDATSAVDPTKEHEIRAALEEVTRGRTTIIIGHRPATIALADRVVVLDGGRIVAEGTHESLLASSPLYREILAQAEAFDELLAGPPPTAQGEDLSTAFDGRP